MRYRESSPTHPCIRQCVARFWSITASGSHQAGEVKVVDLPDGHTEYVINGSAPFSRHVIDQPETASINGRSSVYAQKRQTSVITITGDTDLFCIRFTPFGLYKLCGESLHEITGHAVEPRFLFGELAHELEERILSIPDFTKRAIEAEAVLLKLLVKARAIDPVVLFVLNRIGETKGVIRTHQMASTISRTRRTLESKVRDQVGLTIKSLCRIHRFNHFWKLKKRHPDAEVLRLALDCGFYDQSHFIREFRIVTGDTPLSFLNSGIDVVMNSIPERLSSGAS